MSECGADPRGISALLDVLSACSVSSQMSQHKGLSMFSPSGKHLCGATFLVQVSFVKAFLHSSPGFSSTIA